MSQTPTNPDRLPRSQRQRLLLRMLRRPSPVHLKRLLAKVHPADTAQLFAVLSEEEQRTLLESLFELRLAGSTLRELDIDTQRRTLGSLPDNNLAVILTRLPPDDAADLLRVVSEERRNDLFRLVDPQRGKRLELLVRYGEDTAGGMMNSEVSSFSVDETVGETLERVRTMAGSGRLFYVYVIDRRGHLLGIVNLWQLVVSNETRRLREIMTEEVISVRVDTPREEVARVFSRYDLLLLPVTDEEGLLVGAITVDDILDVVEEEATADLYQLVNLDPQETASSSFWRVLRLRLPGLLVNFFAAVAAAAVILPFVDVVANRVILAVALPIVMILGRSAVDQTLAVVIRSLARGDMQLRRPVTLILRQLAVNLATGLAVGAAVGGLAIAWQGDLMLGVVLAVSITMSQAFAGLLGSTLPLLLSKLGLDPSLLSSPLVATAAQVVGFVFLLEGARLFSHLLS